MSLLQTVDLHALAPVLLLAGTALAVLVADLFLPPQRRGLLAGLALAGTLASLAAVLTLVGGRPRGTFCVPAGRLPEVVGGTAVPQSCSYVADGYALLLQGIVLGALAVVLLLGLPTVRDTPLPAGEYHLLLLCSGTGMLTITAGRDLLVLFVALETLSLPGYVLAGLRRDDRRAGEAALKFFLVSVVSAAVMLLGIALLYGRTGTVHLDRLAIQLADPDVRGPAAAVGVALTLVGFAFKVSAVPFHTWAPDTYVGAPIPVAAFLSVASKVAGFAGLLAVLFVGFAPYSGVWGPALAVLAAVTMTLGNLVALQQQHVVRLLAWSSIAQSGYVLVPLGAAASPRARAEGLPDALPASLTYLTVYALVNLAAFGSVAAVARRSPRNTVDDYRGLAARSPWLAAAFALALLNLAGLPPGLAGLFAKVVVFRATVEGHVVWLGVVLAVNTVIAFAYYVRLVAVLYERVPDAPPLRVAPGPGLGAALVLTSAAALVVGVVPQLVLHITPLATLAGGP
jgi:NADH-quinone oxidoreductase subunit N